MTQFMFTNRAGFKKRKKAEIVALKHFGAENIEQVSMSRVKEHVMHFFRHQLP